MSMNKYLLKAAHYIVNKNKDDYFKSFLPSIDFNVINNRLTVVNHKIIFVIPFMGKFMGGLTSVLRIAKILNSNGYEIFYTAYDSNELESMKNNAAFNLKDYKGEFISYEDALNLDFEFVIATNYRSVFFAKKIKGYKIIFVQDYEPYFSPMGADWIIAQKSYELGFDIISLGEWNIKQIKKFNHIEEHKLHYVEFPFEKKEYPVVKTNYSNYSDLKKIKFAVYNKRDEKRMPSFIFAFFEYANEYIKSKGYQLEPHYFGLNKHEKVSLGVNHGKLGKSEIFDLYKKCDFGLVASLTNVSLVPYEMLSTGLPIFEFEDGSYSDFLGRNSATLIDLDYRHFVDKLIELIKNPQLIENQMKCVSQLMSNLSWEKSGNQFTDVLKAIEGTYNV